LRDKREGEEINLEKCREFCVWEWRGSGSWRKQKGEEVWCFSRRMCKRRARISIGASIPGKWSYL